MMDTHTQQDRVVCVSDGHGRRCVWGGVCLMDTHTAGQGGVCLVDTAGGVCGVVCV